LKARHTRLAAGTVPLARRGIAAVGRLDEAPAAASAHLEMLDVDMVAAAPPLRNQLGLGKRAPYPGWKRHRAFDPVAASSL